MPLLLFHPDEKAFDAEAGETILKVAVRSGVPLAHACGGKARCSTCRVRVVDGLDHCGPRTEAEEVIAGQMHFDNTIRLACQTTFTEALAVRRLVLDDDDLSVSSLIKIGPGPHALGQERRLAILFADLRGFTAFAERLPAYDVIHVLNRWAHHMSRAIERHGGRVDQFIGDGLMALFGVPREGPEAAEIPRAALAAVSAGLDMLAEMDSFNAYLRAFYHQRLRMGVGVHVGNVVVGTIGPGRQTTAIGDAVNLASRVESATKTTAADLLISQDVYDEVGGRLQARASCPLELPGKTGRYTLYQVVGLNAGPTRKSEA